MKVLITGCNGLLGQKLLYQFAPRYEVLATAQEAEASVRGLPFDYHPLDITKRDEVKRVVEEFKPRWIVNAAAYTDVDGCETEKERCWRINVTGVENLAYAARRVGAKIVHLSSDYIFNGKDGPYDEAARPDPLSYYGKSKLASENVLKASGVPHTIARTMVLYGRALNVKPNFVLWLIDQLKNQRPVRVVDDQFGNPTLADNLAQAIERMVALGKTGTYHVSGREVIDRYHFAQKVAQVFGLREDLITPIHTDELKQPAPRPLKSGFIVEKAQRELGIPLLNVEEGLRMLKQQLREGQ